MLRFGSSKRDLSEDVLQGLGLSVSGLQLTMAKEKEVFMCVQG